MTNHLFEPILQIVYDTMPRDNLLNSACLELFEFIKGEKIKPLVVYFVEKYRDQIKEITYVDTFQTLILKYEQFQDYSVENEQIANSQEEEPAATR
jgi:protein phosphatase-4 regulatory subunit 3